MILNAFKRIDGSDARGRKPAVLDINSVKTIGYGISVDVCVTCLRMSVFTLLMTQLRQWRITGRRGITCSRPGNRTLPTTATSRGIPLRAPVAWAGRRPSRASAPRRRVGARCRPAPCRRVSAASPGCGPVRHAKRGQPKKDIWLRPFNKDWRRTLKF